MVVKKAATAKKTPVKGPAKIAAKKRVSKGESIVCEVCGLSVVVEQVGDIVVSRGSVLLCCGKPMKQKAGKARVAATKLR